MVRKTELHYWTAPTTAKTKVEESGGRKKGFRDCTNGETTEESCLILPFMRNDHVNWEIRASQTVNCHSGRKHSAYREKF